MTTHDIPGLIARAWPYGHRLIRALADALAAEHERAEDWHARAQRLMDGFAADERHHAALKADRDALAAKLAEAEERAEKLTRDAESLAVYLEYKGNSVQHWYGKAKELDAVTLRWSTAKEQYHAEIAKSDALARQVEGMRGLLKEARGYVENEAMSSDSGPALLMRITAALTDAKGTTDGQ